MAKAQEVYKGPMLFDGHVMRWNAERKGYDFTLRGGGTLFVAADDIAKRPGQEEAYLSRLIREAQPPALSRHAAAEKLAEAVEQFLMYEAGQTEMRVALTAYRAATGTT